MADIIVYNLTFTSSIDMDTILVEIFADGNFIGERKFSAITYTIEKAESDILFEFQNFGLYIDGEMYKKAEDPPEETNQVETPKEKPRLEIEKYRGSQETDLTTTESINAENSDKVSTVTKKGMRKKTEENNEVASEAKPKLVIKIPKPFGLGYWIIDLSKLLGKILAGLASAILALVLAKLAGLLVDSFQKILDKGKIELSQSDIDGAINEVNIQQVITESESEYSKLKLLEKDSLVDPTLSTTDNSGKIIDKYSKANKNKKNISNKNKYSIDRRNREDILESDVVKERNGSNNKNIKTVRNPNYGTYMD